jgi:hypothetical protein
METLSVKKIAGEGNCPILKLRYNAGKWKSRQAALRQKAALYLRSNWNNFNPSLYLDVKGIDEGFSHSLVQPFQDTWGLVNDSI